MEAVQWGEVCITSCDADCRRYGIRLYLSGGDTLQVDDVTTSVEEAKQFAARLVGEYVDEEQLSYLVEDYLTSVLMI